MHRLPTLRVLVAACMLFFSPLLFALDLTEAKSKGLVAETPSGYLRAVKSTSEVKSLVNSINAKRKQHYGRISKETGASLKAVEQRAGAKLTK